MINCLVVDDEPIARKGLLEHIRQIEFLNAVAECKSATEATGWLQKKNIDLLFLDIQMPKLTGIDFVRNAAVLPAVIFTTAYPDYAIEGYELDVLDYLLKPISFNRFLKAALKAQDYLSLVRGESNISGLARSGTATEKLKAEIPAAREFFFIKCNQKIEKIIIADVLYVEALSNYVIIHTRQKKYTVYITFRSIEEQLAPHHFIRIHKSFIVSINAIRAIDSNEILLDNGTLPLSKTYKEEVMEKIDRLLFKR